MDIYSSILFEIAKESSLQSKHNNLMKFYYKTEDIKLKELLRVYAEYLKEANDYQKRKLYSNCSRTINEGYTAKQALSDYCTELKMRGKPEWQVLAERYGWQPPVR